MLVPRDSPRKINPLRPVASRKARCLLCPEMLLHLAVLASEAVQSITDKKKSFSRNCD